MLTTTNTITVTANIIADVDKVWEYYTNPIHITQWNFADPSWCCPKAENNMTIGGVYKARMEARDRSVGFDFEAIYTDIQRNKQFSYTFGGRTATVTFKPSGKETQITVEFEPETENPIELQQQGWQSILNNFKKYVEEK